MDKVFKLSFPIKAPDGVAIDELRLRRLRAGDVKSIEPAQVGGGTGMILAYVAAMNDLPISSLDELDAGDMIALLGVASSFLEQAFPSATPP